MILLTPEQFVYKKIIKLPSLYATYDNIDQSRYSIMDQLFNVLGNGIYTLEEFLEEISSEELPNKDRALYLLQSNLYYAMEGLEFDRYESFLVVPEIEKINYKNITRWLDIGKIRSWNPYPNFNKKYSIVWQSDFIKNIPIDWVKEAKIFYYTCLQYFIFSNIDQKRYHHSDIQSFIDFINETLSMLENHLNHET